MCFEKGKHCDSSKILGYVLKCTKASIFQVLSQVFKISLQSAFTTLLENKPPSTEYCAPLFRFQADHEFIVRSTEKGKAVLKEGRDFVTAYCNTVRTQRNERTRKRKKERNKTTSLKISSHQILIAYHPKFIFYLIFILLGP